MKLNKEVVRGSFILLIAFNAFSFMNFVYHFSMARMLDARDYGTLAALFSIIYIGGIFSESIQAILTKYSSNEKDTGKLKNLFLKTFRKAGYFAAGIFVLFLFGAILLAKLWDVSYLLIAITGIVIFITFLLPVGRGLMQGRKEFRKLGFNLVLEASIKLGGAILLVFIGLKVFGAIIAVLIGSIIALGYSFYQIRKVLEVKEKQIKTDGIYGQTILIFLFTLAVTLFYSMDIMVAKTVFSAEIAGAYAIASILGKIIFWGTQPVSKAMLPIASQSKKDKLKQVFWNSFAIIGIGMMVVLLFFYFYPELIIQIFSGKNMPDSANILFRIGLSMGILAFSNLILIYKIAVEKPETKKGKISDRAKIISLAKKAVVFIAAIGIQIILIYTAQNNLDLFVNRLLISTGIFFIGTLIALKMK